MGKFTKLIQVYDKLGNINVLDVPHYDVFKKYKHPHLKFLPWIDYTFISGHKGYETKHMDLIPNNPNINKLVTYGSHDVATKFKDSDKLYDVINLYFKEDKVIEQSYLDSLFT